MFNSQPHQTTGKILIIFVKQLGNIPKPTRPALLTWIGQAMNSLELEEGAFFNTVLKDPKGLASNIEESEIGDYELINVEDEYEDEELL